jgi:hypothetical protein
VTGVRPLPDDPATRDERHTRLAAWLEQWENEDHPDEPDWEVEELFPPRPRAMKVMLDTGVLGMVCHPRSESEKSQSPSVTSRSPSTRPGATVRTISSGMGSHWNVASISATTAFQAPASSWLGASLRSRRLPEARRTGPGYGGANPSPSFSKRVSVPPARS